MHLVSQIIDGVPAFYSVDVGRQFGSFHGWTLERDKALQFAREKDAQTFLDIFLPQLAANCQVVSG